MDGRNLLILTVYFIIVTYVLYQAYRSLGNQMTVSLDSDSLNKQLEEQELKDNLEISFRFSQSYKFDELKTLEMTIKNKSSEDTIYVDWDQSYLTDFDKVTGRVIRVLSGMTSIPQSQVSSIIRPGQSLKEELSNEDIVAPLFSPKKIAKAARSEGRFFLRLILKISSPLAGTNRSYTLRCPFIIRTLRLPKALTIALKPKKK